MALIDKLTAIADAMRGKTGKTDGMTLDQMVTEIAGIQTGGGGDILSMIWDKTIEHFTDDTITNITQSGCFQNCTNLKSISMKNVKKINSQYFAYKCTQLVNLDLPLVEEFIVAWGMQDCTSLEALYLPKCKKIASDCFKRCTALKILHGAFWTLSDMSVADCSKLDTIVLTSNKLCSLASLRTFNGTPFAEGGTGGTVYCPSALITQYQQATNWSTLYAAGTCNFVAIEGSEYE